MSDGFHESEAQRLSRTIRLAIQDEHKGHTLMCLPALVNGYVFRFACLECEETIELDHITLYDLIE